ncbi:MAG: anhydro-N-acetylmuramic acid kinase [Bdellovibrionales bacterium]
MKPKLFRALGLMSGTSIDGIDIAMIETDGEGIVRAGQFMTHSYERGFREKLRAAFGPQAVMRGPEVLALERDLTELHAAVVSGFLLRYQIAAENIDLIGFHGQTLWHDPAHHVTAQIGDGAELARLTQIPVVNDFRSADVLAGGQGAPLVPLYHAALASKLPKPVMILNLGGVANVTYVGGHGQDDLLAFDIGPGNALIDDWMLRMTGKPYDVYGEMAASGVPDEGWVDSVLAQPFFSLSPPKALDREAFKPLMPTTLGAADGAATLTRLTARCVAMAVAHMPLKPQTIYVAGGGRLNTTLMRMILDVTRIPVAPVDALGWNGDSLEAEAFAYLAVRSKLGLPISLPGTTGVPQPMRGGALHIPSQ